MRLRPGPSSAAPPILAALGLPTAALLAPTTALAAALPLPPPAPLDMLPVLFALVLVLLGARLGGALFERLGQPSVLGEVLAGVVIGNLGLFGWHAMDGLRHLPALEVLAQIGILFLLFDVGLSCEMGKLLAVGRSALLVASLGVAATIGLGWAASAWLLPNLPSLAHGFLAATLCATSIGITARVLSDLGHAGSREGRIVLGAAVVDDVIGLVVLGVATAASARAESGAALDPGALGLLAGKAIAFLAVAIVAGRWIARRAFGLGTRLPGTGVLLTLALTFCFAVAWLAGVTGLAPIVGAFCAGLVLEEAHYGGLVERDPARRDVRSLLEPLRGFLAPIFFVLIGTRIDLATFDPGAALGLSLALTAVVVVSRLGCAAGVLEPGADRLTVGLGMLPRGEVSLIFAGVGATLTVRGQRVLDPARFSAIVVVVTLTTLLTPPLLAWRLRSLPARAGDSEVA